MTDLENLLDRHANAHWMDDPSESKKASEHLAGAIEAVLELHRRLELSTNHFVCSHCEEDQQVLPWPCPTISAIHEALGVSDD